MPPERDPKRYAGIRRGLWAAETGLSLGLMGWLLASGLAQRISARVEAWGAPWPLEVVIFAGGLWLAGTLLFFPLDWARGFWLERRFGLTEQRWRDWLKDEVKRLALSAGMGLALVLGLSSLLRSFPERWWIWAAGGWLIVSILLTRILPTWLIPLFYTQSPLKDKGLRQRLDHLLRRCGTRVGGIFEVNLSRTTTKANACLCGVGRSRRVLISDTLLSAYPAEEVEMVLAHEMGHHRFHHIGILTCVSAAALAAGCLSVDRAARAWAAPLGLSGLTDPAALVLIGLGLSIVNLILLPITNGLSRRLEAAADRFSLEQTGNPRAFIAAMRRLAQQNLAELSPPAWVEWLLYDHPSIGRRIAMAEGCATRGARSKTWHPRPGTFP